MGRNKEFTREHVLNGAMTLFWQKGFADTSVQQIEKATGVNKSGLYSEFVDKDELFLECLKYYAEASNVKNILNRETTLGWKNIEDFLYLSVSGETPGCFFVNSLREWSLLPARSKNFLETHIQNVRTCLYKNTKKLGFKDEVGDIILTFNSGLALSMNLLGESAGRKRVQSFILWLKNNSI